MDNLRRTLLTQEDLQKINAKPISQLEVGEKIESFFFPFLENVNMGGYGMVTIYFTTSIGRTSGSWKMVNLPDGGPIYASDSSSSSSSSYHVVYSVSEYYEYATFSSGGTMSVLFGDIQLDQHINDFRPLIGYYFEYPLSKLYKPNDYNETDNFFRYKNVSYYGRFYASMLQDNIFVTTVD